jgi:hypothetical protein
LAKQGCFANDFFWQLLGFIHGLEHTGFSAAARSLSVPSTITRPVNAFVYSFVGS